MTITANLCQDVVSIPLLWIAPLVTYLLTFIVTFEARSVVPAVVLASRPGRGVICRRLHLVRRRHAAVYAAARRPPGLVAGHRHGLSWRVGDAAEPVGLTTFYLAIAAGGALGGLAVAVVAPLVFTDTYELPLSILATWILAIAVLVTDRESRFYDGLGVLPAVRHRDALHYARYCHG